MPALAVGNCRRRPRLPGRLLRRKPLAPFPRHLRGSLAPGMADLDADGEFAHAAAVINYSFYGSLVVLVVEAGATVRDAALAGDVRRLDHQQPRAGVGEMAEMHEVPVVH